MIIGATVRTTALSATPMAPIVDWGSPGGVGNAQQS